MDISARMTIIQELEERRDKALALAEESGGDPHHTVTARVLDEIAEVFKAPVKIDIASPQGHV